MKTRYQLHFQIPMLALVAFLSFSSCKKGENDPLSLMSRDGRVVGTWKLTQFDYNETLTETSTSLNGGTTSSSNVTFTALKSGNGTTLTSTYDYADISTQGSSSSTESFHTVITENYGLQVTINEDETAEVMITSKKTNITKASTPADICGGSSTPNLSNSQNFGESNVADISCDGTYTYADPDNITSTLSGYWRWFDGKKNKVEIHIDNLGTFMIDRLSNSELILMDTHSFSDGAVSISDSENDHDVVSSKWTFEKQ